MLLLQKLSMAFNVNLSVGLDPNILEHILYKVRGTFSADDDSVIYGFDEDVL